MTVTNTAYESWLKEVEEALSSINMPMGDWQKSWGFDFRHEFEVGTTANDAAMKANQYWWQQQNKALGQDCRKTPTAGYLAMIRVDVNRASDGEDRDGKIQQRRPRQNRGRGRAFSRKRVDVATGGALRRCQPPCVRPT